MSPRSDTLPKSPVRLDEQLPFWKQFVLVNLVVLSSIQVMEASVLSGWSQPLVWVAGTWALALAGWLWLAVR